MRFQPNDARHATSRCTGTTRRAEHGRHWPSTGAASRCRYRTAAKSPPERTYRRGGIIRNPRDQFGYAQAACSTSPEPPTASLNIGPPTRPRFARPPSPFGGGIRAACTHRHKLRRGAAERDVNCFLSTCSIPPPKGEGGRRRRPGGGCLTL